MEDQEIEASEKCLDQESEMGDLDWLAEVPLGLMANVVIPKRPCSQAGFSTSASYDNNF